MTEFIFESFNPNYNSIIDTVDYKATKKRLQRLIDKYKLVTMAIYKTNKISINSKFNIELKETNSKNNELIEFISKVTNTINNLTEQERYIVIQTLILKQTDIKIGLECSYSEFTIRDNRKSVMIKLAALLECLVFKKWGGSILDLSVINLKETERNLKQKINRYIENKNIVTIKSSQTINSKLNLSFGKTNKLYNSNIEQVALFNLTDERIKEIEEFETSLSILSNSERLLLEKCFIEGETPLSIRRKTGKNYKEIKEQYKQAVTLLAIQLECVVFSLI